MDTVAALCSGPLPCGVALVRLSGGQALPILDTVFAPKGRQSITKRNTNTLYYGELLDRDRQAIDFCLAAFFRTPRSFTGEDVAEFYCHGSRAVVAALLNHLYALGARPAGPGEFTKRAFLSGKLDLAEAEAVADLIYSESAREAKNAVRTLKGAVSQEVLAVRDGLTRLCAHFYAVCDYPDEDIEPFEYAQAQLELEQWRAALLRLHASHNRAAVLREGALVAVIGRPNAGKSALFNALAGFERAIVTDEPGTTRDVIEQKISLGGGMLRLLDTAGIRDSDSQAERQGVARAKQAAEGAAAVLYVVDGNSENSEFRIQNSELRSQFDGSDEASQNSVAAAIPSLNTQHLTLNACPLPSPKPCCAVVTKIDLGVRIAPEALRGFDRVFYVSSKTGEGLPALCDWLAQLCAPDDGEVLVASARVAALLGEAAEALSRASGSAKARVTPDAFLLDAEKASALLGEALGEGGARDIASEIFARFCVGK